MMWQCRIITCPLCFLVITNWGVRVAKSNEMRYNAPKIHIVTRPEPGCSTFVDSHFVLCTQEREDFMASDCSFDIVSQFDEQELLNAIDQTRREVQTRFDLKDTKTEIAHG